MRERKIKLALIILAIATVSFADDRQKQALLDIPDIVERLNPSVVNVRAIGPSGENLGSGFIIDPSGLIVTNFHLISYERSGKSFRLADRILVTLSDGRQFPASIKGYDEATDVALLQISTKEARLQAAELGDSDALRVGEWVIAIGNPLGFDHTVTVGIISAKGRSVLGGQFEELLQTDAAINLGNSGGPLVNAQGKVIGMNTLIIERTQGLGFAIPINTIKAVLPQLIEQGRVARGFLGVEAADLTPELRGQLKLPQDARGIVVVRAERDTPAAKAGLRRDDLIVAVDGQQITSRVQFNRIIAAKAPGDKISIQILRDGRTYTLSAEIGQQIPPQ
jgi:serine protease Do